MTELKQITKKYIEEVVILKFKKHFLFILIIVIITTLMVMGCTSKQEDNSSVIEENANSQDSIANIEVEAQDPLTLSELKNLLETSTRIEVKNIDNHIIGIVNTGEKINKAISNIFAYDAVDNYEYSPKEDVIAIISFYPLSNEPIYGLVKDKFIYIDGYYFTTKSSSMQDIIDYFQINNEEEPIV